MHAPASGLHEHFEARARERPTHIAARHGDESLSYEQLDHTANAVAASLLKAGVRVQDRVGVWLGGELPNLIGALGALKAGATFVPFDRRVPVERVRESLLDAGAGVVLTDATLASTVSGWGLTPVLVVPSVRAQRPPPTLGPRPEWLAYVVYTSGSTGKPKGVAVSHGAILNTLRWTGARYGVDAESVCANVIGWSVDAAIQASWEPLVHGGTLSVADQELKLEPRKLAEWMRSEAITVCHVVPVLLRPMLEQNPDALKGLRTVICGGDELRWLGFRDVPFELYNAYGPTECACTALAAPVPTNQDPAPPPIGHPIEGVDATLVDADTCASDRLGELFLGGAGVARGYHGRPAQTAERFVPDPFGAEPGARGYRTGDLARRLDDGQLVFAGRADRQVKIRGNRVELKEIEIVLAAMPSVVEVAVVVRERGDDKQLLGYLALEPGSDADAVSLRAELARLVPDYMVPSHFVLLDRLPRNPSGKVDPAQLPEPQAPSVESDIEYASELEKQLCGLYAEVLDMGLGEVSPSDTFLGLGGDSVRVMKLVWHAEQRGISLSFKAVFKTPIGRMAEALESGEALEEQAPASEPQKPAPRAQTPERFSLVGEMDQATLEALFNDE